MLFNIVTCKAQKTSGLSVISVFITGIITSKRNTVHPLHTYLIINANDIYAIHKHTAAKIYKNTPSYINTQVICIKNTAFYPPNVNKLTNKMYEKKLLADVKKSINRIKKTAYINNGRHAAIVDRL